MFLTAGRNFVGAFRSAEGAFRIAVVARTAPAVVARTAEDFRIAVVARTAEVGSAQCDQHIAVGTGSGQHNVTSQRCSIAAAGCKPAKPAARCSPHRERRNQNDRCTGQTSTSGGE